MSAAATYKILDWIEDVDSEVFLYISGDNTPERAAVKFRNMLNIYNTGQSASPADAFIAAERTSPSNFSFRDSHEQDVDTAYRYNIEFSLHTQSFLLTAETVQRVWWRKKPVIRPFFKGSVEEFIQRYSSAPSFATGLYKIHDKNGQDVVWFRADRGNNPCEAAYRLALMNGLHRSGKITYADAFNRANGDIRFYPYTGSHESSSDYLYILEPFTDEEGWESFILKAYADGNNRHLFFEGCLEEFIQIFGKN